MKTRSPLDIPEILSLIASFVPVWEEPNYRHSLYITPRSTFIPRDLLACAASGMASFVGGVHVQRHIQRSDRCTCPEQCSFSIRGLEPREIRRGLVAPPSNFGSEILPNSYSSDAQRSNSSF